MRHVIYFLVVANLVFFLWHAIQGPTVGEPGLPALPANVKLLVTLEFHRGPIYGQCQRIRQFERSQFGVIPHGFDSSYGPGKRR